MVPEFGIPLLKVLVGELTGDVEHQDARIGLVIIGSVEVVEALLSGGVPDVHLEVLALLLCLVSVHGQGVGGQLSLFTTNNPQ